MKYSHTKDRPRKKTLWRRDKCHYDTQGDIEVTTMSRTSSSNGDSDALDTAEKKTKFYFRAAANTSCLPDLSIPTRFTNFRLE